MAKKKLLSGKNLKKGALIAGGLLLVRKVMKGQSSGSNATSGDTRYGASLNDWTAQADAQGFFNLTNPQGPNGSSASGYGNATGASGKR